jgi:hypothetical protein
MARIKEDVQLISPDRKSVKLEAGDEIPEWADVPEDLILGPDDPEPSPIRLGLQRKRRSW